MNSFAAVYLSTSCVALYWFTLQADGRTSIRRMCDQYGEPAFWGATVIVVIMLPVWLALFMLAALAIGLLNAFSGRS